MIRAVLFCASLNAVATCAQPLTQPHTVRFGPERPVARRVEAALDKLAELMRDNDVLVRVVGYTDDQGGQDRNSPLSAARAQKVADALVARKVPAHRLIAVGRLDALDLSPVAGGASPNRRVQFEVGFEGEAAQ